MQAVSAAPVQLLEAVQVSHSCQAGKADASGVFCLHTQASEVLQGADMQKTLVCQPLKSCTCKTVMTAELVTQCMHTQARTSLPSQGSCNYVLDTLLGVKRSAPAQ